MAELTHFDAKGDAHMVDVGAKAQTKRIARARGEIHMAPATFALCAAGTAKKGDVIGVARIAAIMASKRTSELIPLCHPIALTHVSVDFELDEAKSKVVCIAQCECSGQTGVEMEALTAVQVGLLTVYDMLKAVDRGMVMTEICLLEKDGGKSGHWLRSCREAEITCCCATVAARERCSIAALKRHKPHAGGFIDRFAARMNAELFINFLDVGGDGMRRDAKNAADFRERNALGQQHDDFAFAL